MALLEYKEQLSSGVWNVLVPAQVATGPSMSVNDTLNAAPQRFYRVVTP